MCFSPIKILNKTLTLSVGTPLIMQVPCGHCDDCKKQTRNDYFVRSYFEYIDCIKKGGFCYFETLTYNEESLPRFHNVPCFSKEDIRLFFQRLKKHLSIRGFKFGKETKNSLRYLVTCEYGGKNGRVHYHMLLFVNVPGLSVPLFKFCVRKSWDDKGFSNPLKGYKRIFGVYQYIDVFTWVVKSSAALNYVCKYITKSVDFEYDVQDHIPDFSVERNIEDPKVTFDDPEYYLLNTINCLNTERKEIEKLGTKELKKKFPTKKEFIKKIGPFRLNSNGYGASLSGLLSEEEIISNKFRINYSPFGIDHYFSIPKYIKRKLLQEYSIEVENDKKFVLWHYTKFGQEIKLKQKNENLSRMAERLSHSSQNFNNLVGKFIREGQAIDQRLIMHSHIMQGLSKYVDYKELSIYNSSLRYSYFPRSIRGKISLQTFLHSNISKFNGLKLSRDLDTSERLKPFINEMFVGSPGEPYHLEETYSISLDNYYYFRNVLHESSENNVDECKRDYKKLCPN